MKSVFKVIILLMIVFMIFAGCSNPQDSSSSGSSDSQQSKSTDGNPFDVEIPNNSMTISVDNSNQDYATGTDDNFFYNFWKDKAQKGGFPANQGTASMYIWKWGSGYGFWAFWDQVHGIVGGRGWNTGKVNLVLTFHGWSYSSADQNGVDDDHYFGVYGWADNGWDSSHPERLIEYYIIEQHGTKSHGLTQDPNVNVTGYTRYIDGSNYTAYKTRRVGMPSIRGSATDFDQYWSVRATQRQSGTMNFASHVDMWGDHYAFTRLTDNMMNDQGATYQILFVEAPYDDYTGTGNGFGFIDSFSGR